MLEGVKAHSGALWSVGVAPDKRGFVTGGADHNVKFWEFELVSDEVVKSRCELLHPRQPHYCMPTPSLVPRPTNSLHAHP